MNEYMDSGKPFPSLEGHCPSCGQQKLFRGFRGLIGCGNDECDDPLSAHRLLSDPYIHQHLVIVTNPWGTRLKWKLRHPVRERLGANGFSCPLSKELDDQKEQHPGLTPGRYRLDVSPNGEVWDLTLT